MRRTIIFTSWVFLKVGGYSENEYAYDSYYENGVYVGSSGCYYTGRYR